VEEPFSYLNVFLEKVPTAAIMLIKNIAIKSMVMLAEMFEGLSIIVKVAKTVANIAIIALPNFIMLLISDATIKPHLYLRHTQQALQ
jgi:hypothetical protein